MIPLSRRLVACLPLITLACPGWVIAQTYSATELPFSVGFGKGAELMGGTPINNAGQVVGFATNTGGTVEGFVFSKGKPSDLGPSLTPISINNAGQIAGTRENADFSRAFLYANGTLKDLGTLGSYAAPPHNSAINYSFANAINSSGQVIGRSTNPAGGETPFLYSDGKMSALRLGSAATAVAINGTGAITGAFFAAPGMFHAFLYRNGAVTDLGTLGGAQSFGNAINDNGQVTGTAETADGGPVDAFLYANGKMRDLGSLNGSGSIGYAINIAGEVVGLSRRSANAGANQTIATLWKGVNKINLNTALTRPLPANVSLIQAIGINDNGWIVANAWDGKRITAYLLTPVAPLTVACPTPAAEAGTAYSSALTVAGGIPPYRFSSTGNLPSGLNLDASNGILAGAPSAAGNFTFTAQVVDASEIASGGVKSRCAIDVSPASLQLKAFPSIVSFGTVGRFRLSYDTVTLMNTGTRPVSISKTSVTPAVGTDRADFKAISFCGSSLAPGRSCAIKVLLFAHNVGPQSATLNVRNDAVGSPQTIPLSVIVRH